MKKFSSYDLDYGNVVECRNGQRMLVTRKNICTAGRIWTLEMLNGDVGFIPSHSFTDDLLRKDRDWKGSDIVKVYEDYTCKELLWERREVTLTVSERTILANLDPMYKYIARSNDGTLYIYGTKPMRCRYNTRWTVDDLSMILRFSGFDHLFQFITWEDEEPYVISYLLKGE